MKLPTINNKFKEPDLKDEPSPFQNREARNQKQYNWDSLRKWGGGFASIFDDILGQFTGTLTEMIDHFNDMVANPANKDIDMSEVRIARKPQGEDAYPTLGDRLNAGDQQALTLHDAADSLQKGSFIVNQSTGFNKMSLLYKMPQPAGGRGVFQTAQKDPKTGFIYTCEQTDAAGSQTINKYDPETQKLITSHNLNLESVIWFEGNSLYHDSTTDEAMFILPYDLLGNWFIYNFDKDEKSEPFKMPGQAKYCIDDSGQYFINIDSQGNPGVNGYVTGFNIFDLQSVIKGNPALVNYIPVKDGLVRGANKIQGFQMVDEVIYIGRGKASEWYRTTVIDISGAVIGDYVWNGSDLKKLVGVANDYTIESEGISWTVLDGVNVPVLLSLVIGNTIYYAMTNLNDPNGTPVNYSSGVTVAGLTRPENTGVTKGLAITTAADGVNLLTRLSEVSEMGTYYFTASEGNEGLAPEMGSATGMAIVRQMENHRPVQMVATAIDYRNNLWTIYYEKGKWSRWAKSDSRVPLWKGASNMASPVTLDKPITPYKMIEVLYQTSGGQVDKAYGARHISLNTTNNDGSATAFVVYESVMSFPTDSSALLEASSVINMATNASGAVTMVRSNASAITVLEIWGVV